MGAEGPHGRPHGSFCNSGRLSSKSPILSFTGTRRDSNPAPTASSSEKPSPTSPNSGASALAHTQPRSDPASFRPAFPLSGVKVCLPGCESVSHGHCLTHCCFPFPAGLAQLGTWEPGSPCLWHSGIKYVSSRQGWVGSLVATSGMALLSHSRSLNSQACQTDRDRRPNPHGSAGFTAEGSK